MKRYYDVIVVGGGPAGIMSAMASGKLGASTLLVEKNGFLGGAATAAVLGPISPFHYKDEQVIDGLPQDFMDRMVRAKGSTGHMKTIDPYGSGDSLGFYDREKYKYVAAEMLVEFGVDILYHATLSSVQMESSRVTGITVAAKSGDLLPLHAHVVVDATGDGDVAVMAGENYVLGDAVNHKMSPSSSMFEMANVDTGRVYQYILDHPDDFEFKSDIVPMREFDERLRQKYFVGQGFKQLVRQAVEKGELSFGRDSVIVLNGIHPNTMHFNATRICGKNATDVVERSESELDGRRQIESVSEFMIQYVPGFEHAFVSVTGSEVGVRETRHIEGLYTLTGQDAYEGRKFEDSVSRGYFPIDLHNPDGATGYGNGGVWMVLKDTFDIPYRSLVPKHIDGLLLSGRCISGTSEAHGSYRTQGGIMGIGQAAGAAAAVCVRNQAQPRQQDVKEIQAALDQLGGLYRRDEARARKEKARARAITQAYIKSQNGRLITDKAILASYED
ncbi:FAD-dependent oxidoreductase [Flavonifractor sp. DFI.6.63]|uniref:FAD-dependent oxidoreductase n=1 Tax=Lawsonibacter hominis TaxID=2763053 RepID=A0A8J6M9C5_9FIRM|nr:MULTISPECIES: FAD-dependent oxidoreductase [Oscillospiraceae]MBS1383092.1 FAD-dependent oxidoreductase [Flavonifractor sp.]MDU2194538.1 FAD-dependent oxidoreductase [Clostridiales bacterium]MDY2977991.1 FAD-dependent oxidoreductase [Oscillospiraceae bacterium]MBC5733085.1 FAD-dependent oxidoreductase [Lawsonibacter hominis]MCI6399010.1 FAD-dependent oxidoreductase [Lawsonibacter sp.]